MASKRTTVRDLRRHNRSLLLSKLYFDGPLSRHELSQLTGLSAATVSNVTAELGEERLITEAGQVESDGGRPRVLLRVDPAYGHVAGVDIGETGVKVELFDLAMNRLATVEHPLPKAPDPATAVEQVTSGLREVFASAGIDESGVLGVGIGVPGAVEQGTEVLVHAPTVGWDAVPFVSLLVDAGVRLPLFIDNGAKTQGQAEMWFGAGRGARHAVIALIGSGVGALDTEGAPYRTGFGEPAEVGKQFLTNYLVAFEVASLLLLIAAVGAVILARRRSGVPDAAREISVAEFMRREVADGEDPELHATMLGSGGPPPK